MEQRPLGNSDLTVSVLGLGCNNFGGSRSSATVAKYGSLGVDETRAVVEAALDCGVTFFDTADVYGNGGSEEFLGKLLGSRRDDVVIGTKWGSGVPEGTPFGRPEHVRSAVEGSLTRLGTDSIDLFQMHWPDPLTPLAETLGALTELVTAGKIRHIGSSHLTGDQVLAADHLARTSALTGFRSAQNEYSLLHRAPETDLLPACVTAGVGVLAYFPLASGLLTGKYRRDAPAPEGARLAGRAIDDAVYEQLERFEAFAAARGLTLLEFAIAAVAAREGVSSVITGATRPEQVRANAAAVGRQLTSADVAALDAS